MNKLEKEKPLGIPNYGFWYIKTNAGQNPIIEMSKIHDFISNTITTREDEFKGNKKLQFINYGSTQLVYVLTLDNVDKYTLLVSQPSVELGTGKKEFDNLKEMSSKNDNVIKPIIYCTDKRNELYITPYEYQARCIGVEEKDWGVWIPEPDYYFKNFTKKEKKIINTSMVAILVNLYDEENNTGIINCKLDGGDFILKKGYEEYPIDHNNVLEHIELIAARDKINCSLANYIDLIKNELSGKSKEHILIQKDMRRYFSEEEINEGITLGLESRKEKSKRLIKNKISTK